MEPAKQDVVILHIEGQNLTVNRANLIENSDYFKAMFLGNFAERHKNLIELNVPLEAMTNLLKMLCDKETVLELELLLGVLELSCMLQFLKIQKNCLDRLKKLLSVSNCLEVWFATERLPLCEFISSRAKLMAVLEFYSVKETQSFLDLSIWDLCAYLGSIFLQARSEFDVFEAFMKWCSVDGDFEAADLCQLLDCLNTKELTETDLGQILQNPRIVSDNKLTKIFQEMFHKKTGQIEKISPTDLNLCNKLMRSQDRILDGFPCIILDNLGPLVDNNEKAIQKSSAVFYYDPISKSLKKFPNVESHKFVDSSGFEIVGHRQFLYMMSTKGQTNLYYGWDWDTEFISNDMIKNIWSTKSRFPFMRNCETCTCEDYLYVIGCTGRYYSIKSNIFWYSLKEDQWCLEGEKFPCPARQLKCCCFNGTLFLLNINSRLGYFHIRDESRWQPITILDPYKELPNFSQNLTVFGYKGDLYIKDKCLLRLTRTAAADSFSVVQRITLAGESGCADASESLLCVNTLYTISRKESDEINEYKISLDALDMKTYKQVNIFSKSTKDSFEVEKSRFKFRSELKIFNMFHPLLVADNLLVNEK